MPQCLDCLSELDSPRKKYCIDCTKRRHREREYARYQADPISAAAKKQEARQRPEVKERERVARRRHYESHREQIIARQSVYYQAHKEERQAYWARYRQEHRERYLESSRRSAQKRKEAQKTYLKDYRIRNADRLRAHDRERDKNPQRKAMKKRDLKNYLSNPTNRSRYIEQVKLHAHLRRRAEGCYTPEQIQVLFLACGYKCLVCRTTEQIQIDHIVPIKRGGTNWITNLQPLCRTCNRNKFTKTVDYRTPEIIALAEALLAA